MSPSEPAGTLREAGASWHCTVYVGEDRKSSEAAWHTVEGCTECQGCDLLACSAGRCTSTGTVGCSMAVDIFLLIFVVAVIGGAVAVNVRVLLHFQQPEDARFASSVLAKTIIVVSLTLAWILILLLPIDVRNSRPTPGVLNMQMLWTIAFILLAVFLALVVPAAVFYVEVEGDSIVKKKRKYVLCNLTLMLFFAGCTLAISYPFLSNASIPVVEYMCDSWLDADRPTPPAMVCDQGKDASLEIKTGFQVYLIAVLCFVGWFFFVTFGGIGLSAVPIDLILSFVDRPRSIDESTYRQRRSVIGSAATMLLGRAEELQKRDGEVCGNGWRGLRQRRALRQDFNKFKRDMLLLEDQFEQLKVSKFHKGESLAVSITKLIVGIIFAILSLTWVLHIVLYVLVPGVSGSAGVPFLNSLFTALEGGGLYPLGVSFFAVFNLYLLLCVLKGCLKFGMRILFFFSIHPMRYKQTPLNSILFNVQMLLLSSAAVVQFSTTCFAEYARLTDADVIFSGQIKYLHFYSFFFKNNVFIWTLLVWFLLALIYLLVRPRDSGETKLDQKAYAKLTKMLEKNSSKGEGSASPAPSTVGAGALT